MIPHIEFILIRFHGLKLLNINNEMGMDPK
jgi:hypothetical protein